MSDLEHRHSNATVRLPLSILKRFPMHVSGFDEFMLLGRNVCLSSGAFSFCLFLLVADK